MILRTVLAVLVAAALFAAAAPAIDHARATRADGEVAADVAALETAASSLAADETVPDHRAGARRTVRIRVPGRAWDVAPVAVVRLTSASTRTVGVTYRFEDGEGRTRTRVVASPVPIDTADGDPIELRGGAHDLSLALREGDPRRIVLDRAGS